MRGFVVGWDDIVFVVSGILDILDKSGVEDALPILLMELTLFN